MKTIKNWFRNLAAKPSACACGCGCDCGDGCGSDCQCGSACNGSADCCKPAASSCCGRS